MQNNLYCNIKFLKNRINLIKPMYDIPCFKTKEEFEHNFILIKNYFFQIIKNQFKVKIRFLRKKGKLCYWNINNRSIYVSKSLLTNFDVEDFIITMCHELSHVIQDTYDVYYDDSAWGLTEWLDYEQAADRLAYFIMKKIIPSFRRIFCYYPHTYRPYSKNKGSLYYLFKSHKKAYGIKSKFFKEAMELGFLKKEKKC